MAKHNDGRHAAAAAEYKAILTQTALTCCTVFLTVYILVTFQQQFGCVWVVFVYCGGAPRKFCEVISLAGT